MYHLPRYRARLSTTLARQIAQGLASLDSGCDVGRFFVFRFHKQCDKVTDFPQAGRDTSGHRRSHAQSAVNPNEVVSEVVERNVWGASIRFAGAWGWAVSKPVHAASARAYNPLTQNLLRPANGKSAAEKPTDSQRPTLTRRDRLGGVLHE